MSIPRFETRFALASLATWRVSHLLTAEDGPWEVVVRVRQSLGSGVLGQLMDCFYCLSVWIAAPISLVVARRLQGAILTWLALSGAACLLERVAERSADPPLKTDPNGVANVLWSEADRAQSR
jgi:hypothetical protein